VKVIVIGGGWSGIAAACDLADRGVNVELLEAAPVLGGHSRMETLCGVLYEANGPHVFHTHYTEVVEWLEAAGLQRRSYVFCPMTEIELAEDEHVFMSWPIQLHEVEALPCWPQVRHELSALPEQPSGDNLEAYCVSLMGRTLYELFIEGYTRKQWGCDPSELSASIGPKRIELRTNFRPLHRDRWQFFPPDGVVGVMERLLKDRRISVTCGARTSAAELAGEPADGFVVTAALDEFVAADPLPWRGVHLRSTYYPDIDRMLTPAHVINRPSMQVPYTRTIETKHASGSSEPGTVVSYEYPGADAKHYPIPTPGRIHEQRNAELQRKAAEMLGRPTAFGGRLATYSYIDQDDAIVSGWGAGTKIAVMIGAA
jgi:UDP-galactopyranose mutase